MKISAYIHAIKDRLLTDPIILSFQIVRERQNITEAHLRVRLQLVDDSFLEFSEFVHRTNDDIQLVTYSYHWADSQGNLIKRWDNAPHFPDLDNFPHHIHDGKTGATYSGTPANIFQILTHIAQAITNSQP